MKAHTVLSSCLAFSVLTMLIYTHTPSDIFTVNLFSYHRKQSQPNLPRTSSRIISTGFKFQLLTAITGINKLTCKASSQINVSPTLIQGVYFSGCFDTAKSYSIFSFTWDSNHSGIGYSFYSPLTALAWNRIGFHSIVVVSVVMDDDHWKTDGLLFHIVHSLLEQNAFLIFLNTNTENTVIVSQTSRCIVPAIIDHIADQNMLVDKQGTVLSCDLLKEVYMITSDSDIWPLTLSWYNLDPSKKILSTNPFCCPKFVWSNTTYQMFPMTAIGMKTSTWLQVLKPTNWKDWPPLNSSQLIDALSKKLGPDVQKASNKGLTNWYTDQKIVSILLAEWIHKYGNRWVQYNRKKIRRINRIRWHPTKVVGMTDAHMPFNPQKKVVWIDSIIPLLNLMYGKSSKSLTWCNEYFAKFNDIYYI